MINGARSRFMEENRRCNKARERRDRAIREYEVALAKRDAAAAEMHEFEADFPEEEAKRFARDILAKIDEARKP